MRIHHPALQVGHAIQDVEQLDRLTRASQPSQRGALFGLVRPFFHQRGDVVGQFLRLVRIVGFLDLKGNLNHAIMIRTFLCKNNTLFYQAGAGIVSESKEENELQEVNNKLGALKKAILMAKSINN